MDATETEETAPEIVKGGAHRYISSTVRRKAVYFTSELLLKMEDAQLSFLFNWLKRLKYKETTFWYHFER